MPWHHVIPKHEWKKRFGDLRGVNDIDNLVNLTVEQHSQVHKFCYEITGNIGDLIASRAILGDIGREQIKQELGRLGGKMLKGKRKTQSHILNMSESRKGKVTSKETIDKLRRSAKSSSRVQKHLKSLHESLKGIPRPKVQCPYCNKLGGIAAMRRWHFDMCKNYESL